MIIRKSVVEEKVTIVKPVTVVHLTLSEREAQILYNLVSRIGGYGKLDTDKLTISNQERVAFKFTATDTRNELTDPLYTELRRELGVRD